MNYTSLYTRVCCAVMAETGSPQGHGRWMNTDWKGRLGAVGQQGCGWSLWMGGGSLELICDNLKCVMEDWVTTLEAVRPLSRGRRQPHLLLPPASLFISRKVI